MIPSVAVSSRYAAHIQSASNRTVSGRPHCLQFLNNRQHRQHVFVRFSPLLCTYAMIAFEVALDLSIVGHTARSNRPCFCPA